LNELQDIQGSRHDEENIFSTTKSTKGINNINGMYLRTNILSISKTNQHTFIGTEVSKARKEANRESDKTSKETEKASSQVLFSATED
jgi:hypothetical protein